MNVPTINEVLQVIRVVHNFYEATSENVQLICDLERIERDLQCSIPLQGSRHKLQISSMSIRKCEYCTYFICFMLCFVYVVVLERVNISGHWRP